jgi:hypothetical protein
MWALMHAPPTELPQAPEESVERVNDMLAMVEEAPSTTPNFITRQGYLNPAPQGIDAFYAWTKNGGKGKDVNIIDLEWGWRFTHEDLTQNQGGVVSGLNSTNDNHRTAVIGEIGGDQNSIGITGICPDAVVSAVSFTNQPTAKAIRQAANRLRSGDIMLLEVHRAGPRYTFQPRDDQKGYVAIEWWPDDYAAIKYATDKGVIVVEAAGNGRENLDDAIYDTNPAPPYGPFPSWWKNPYKRNPLDSQAIIVGAGAPPPGTHGRSHGPDRSRLGFSNYGSCVDAQGWGREVTSTGYGDLQGGSDRDYWYTDTFSGTSSASPIVVGAVGCIQGINRANSKILLTPTTARKILRETGSPQQGALGRLSSQRIGNRPNLRELIDGRGRDCFIATAVYGSRLAPDVQYLREFRDNALLKSGYKTAFEGLLDLYYRVSPPIAYKMQENKPLKNIIRKTIVSPIVKMLKAFVKTTE